MKPKLLKITWLDSVSTDAWATSKDAVTWANNAMLTMSFGHLVKKTKKYLLIASTVCEDGNMSRFLMIPRSLIKEVREYKK